MDMSEKSVLSRCLPEVLTEVRPGDYEDLKYLMQVLSPRVRFSPEVLQRVLDNPHSRLYVVRADGHIVACAALCVFDSLSGRKASVEDVVVHPDYQGQGLAAAMMRYVLPTSDGKGPVTVQLTSRPSRVAANALYRRLGFTLKETNFYVKVCE